MKRGHALLPVLTLIALSAAVAGCSGEPETATSAGAVELARFPLDGEVPPDRAAVFDPNVSQDGNGSLRVTTAEGGLLRLYQLDELGIVQGQIALTGFLRSRGLAGLAMLELRCQPAEGDAAFVRGVPRAVSGDSDWRAQDIRFGNPALCRDPVSIQINLWFQGSGTVWVDHLRLWSVPAD